MSRARDLSKLGNPNIIKADENSVGFGTQVAGNPANASSSLISAGIVTAAQFFGDGSNLEGVASAGLGTAVDDTKDSIGQNIYFTNAELSINENTTVNAPDSSNIAYTQYQQVTVESGSELIIADGDSFIPDVLGIGTALQASTAGAGNGLFDTVFTDNIERADGRGAPNFPKGLTLTGVSTFTGSSSFSGNVSIGGTLTYEDVTNVDSIGVVTARNGIDINAGGLDITSGGINVTGISTFAGDTGIGEDNPDVRLHVKETIDVGYSVYNSIRPENNIFKLENPSTTANAFAGMQFRTGGGADMFFGSIQQTGNAGDLYVTNQNSPNTEIVRIKSTGQILSGNYFTSKQIGDFESSLQIQGTTGNTSSMSIFRYSADAEGSNLTLGKGRGGAGEVNKPQDGDVLGAVRFVMANNNNLTDGTSAKIQCNVDGDPGGGDYPSRLSFFTAADASNTPTERLRITRDGNLRIGTANGIAVGTNVPGAEFLASNGSELRCGLSGTGNGTQVRFYNGNGEVGSIKTNGSSTVYHTSSDYRLKENAVIISDVISKVKQLKPYTFNFKADSSIKIDGFFAHEAQEVVPYAVSGEKDAEEMQSMDYGKLTPLLTAALQEAISEIETLKTEVAALKSQLNN